MSKIDDILASEGGEAESYDTSAPLPEGVTTSRPRMGASTVVSVRLSADEHNALRLAAEDAGLPVSTLIRIWALEHARAEREGNPGSVAERLTRLENKVFHDAA